MLQVPQVDGIRQHPALYITSEVLNVNLVSESAWLQASLLVSEGGLGMRIVYSPACTFCLFGLCCWMCCPFQRHPAYSPPFMCTFSRIRWSTALWNTHVAVSPPQSPDDCHQKAWDSPRISARLHHLIENVQDPASRARLLAASCQESGAWLNALPVSSLGLRMDDVLISIAVSQRLGTPLCHPHPCIQYYVVFQWMRLLFSRPELPQEWRATCSLQCNE